MLQLYAIAGQDLTWLQTTNILSHALVVWERKMHCQLNRQSETMKNHRFLSNMASSSGLTSLNLRHISSQTMVNLHMANQVQITQQPEHLLKTTKMKAAHRTSIAQLSITQIMQMSTKWPLMEQSRDISASTNLPLVSSNHLSSLSSI